MEARYTHGHTSGILANHATRSVADSAAFLVPHLEPGMHLLDLGCGPGSITIELATHVAHVDGVDASPQAIAAAARAAGSVDNVQFHVADVHALPFDAASFDVVFAHQVLQHLGDPVSALREARRVLKPGGIVAVRDADYGTMVHAPHDARLDRWLDLYRRLARRNGAEADAGRRLLGWVQAAGFEDPTVTTTTWTYATPQAISAWRDLWIGRLTEGRMARDLVDLGFAGEEELVDLVAAWTDWARAPSPFFAFLHGEVVARSGDSAGAESDSPLRG